MTNPHPINPATLAKNVEANSRTFLDIEPKIYELRWFAVLALHSFEFLFDTEAGKRHGDTISFTVQADQFYALQFAIDEVNRRTRESREAL